MSRDQDRQSQRRGGQPVMASPLTAADLRQPYEHADDSARTAEVDAAVAAAQGRAGADGAALSEVTELALADVIQRAAWPLSAGSHAIRERSRDVAFELLARFDIRPRPGPAPADEPPAQPPLSAGEAGR